MARFVAFPEHPCTDREVKPETNKSLTRSYRAMKLLCGTVEKLDPSIDHHMEAIRSVLFPFVVSYLKGKEEETKEREREKREGLLKVI